MQPPRILVTYASGYGSTAGVAETMASTLRAAGVAVDLYPVERAPAPAGYDATIIGAPIRHDTWMPAARHWLERHQGALSATPVAVFFTCMTLSLGTEKAEEKARAYAAKIAALVPGVRPVDVGGFAGALDFRAMAPLPRLVARVLFAFFGAKSGDYRDFAAIGDWARQNLARIDRQIARPAPLSSLQQ